MNYVQAEQRLKELLFTGFMVEVNYDYDTSLEVEKLFHKLYESDKTLFMVEEVFEEGLFFEEGEINYFALSAGCWGYFGINELGQTEISDTSELPTIRKSELQDIVEVLTSEDKIKNEVKYQSKVTGAVYTCAGERSYPTKKEPDVLLELGRETVHCPKKNLLKCFDLVVDDKFEAVSGDQSLFDLVGATDEHFYIVRNSKLNGIYATDFKLAKERILAERKLKTPEHISYYTEHYPHEDYEGKVYAFRARTGETAINFIDGDYSGEVVLTPENTIKFANELIAIANGVERKDYK